jgi:hypothetical protein
MTAKVLNFPYYREEFNAFCIFGDKMNSFETDLRRAVLSIRFLLGAALQLLILWTQGEASALYRMSLPIVCTLPYACGWLEEYKTGYARLALSRGSMRGYILGKFLSCCIAGGGAEVLAAWLYVSLKAPGTEWDYGRTLLVAALWAAVAAVLAALSGSRYIAFGGAFVVCYFLVIVSERYWPGLYCLYPYEWLDMRHTWPFGGAGVTLLLIGLLLVLFLCYYIILKGRIERD